MPRDLLHGPDGLSAVPDAVAALDLVYRSAAAQPRVSAQFHTAGRSQKQSDARHLPAGRMRLLCAGVLAGTARRPERILPADPDGEFLPASHRSALRSNPDPYSGTGPAGGGDPAGVRAGRGRLAGDARREPVLPGNKAAVPGPHTGHLRSLQDSRNHRPEQDGPLP